MSNQKDLVLNHLSFNTGAFMDMVKKITNMYLDDLSYILMAIVITEILKNGNGSMVMRIDASSKVKETKREVTDDHITLEVGIDLDELQSNEEMFVRVSVVLYGNMKGNSWTWRDAEVMYTKPGQETWGKNVTNKKVHVPEHYKPRAMPGFAQPNKYRNIAENISVNTKKEAEKYVGLFVNNVNHALNSINLSAFLEVR